MAPRYAIYFVPPQNAPLYRFGAAVLGYDCYGGKDVPFPHDVPSDWANLVREPRVYGFHATLKAPFRLAPGLSENDLINAMKVFAEERATVQGGRLAVRALGSFIALVPSVASADINRLAGRCARDFDRFRAPLTEEERARRLASPLSAAQIEHLDRWGYPYVFEDFRFHMTLTGSLEAERRDRTLNYLQEKFEQVPDAQHLLINQVVVARQDGKGAPFHIVAAMTLGHSVSRPYAYSL